MGKDSKAFPLPLDVLYILEVLHNAGYEAYIVGGCVRDMLLNKLLSYHINIHDYDIATSALPAEVCALFPRTIPTGLKHGTISVLLHSKTYEITTFRIEGSYSNHRSPDSVRFTSLLKDDLKRRDFTINALAYAPHCGVVDMMGGVQDILKKRIICVGEPKARFSEDALRILRALRFSATFGFEIESSTKQALFSQAPLLQNIAKERIRIELEKLLCGDYALSVIEEFREIINLLVPLRGDVSILGHLSVRKAPIVWVCLLYGVRDEASNILDHLRFDKKSKAYILTLLQYYEFPPLMDKSALIAMIVHLGGRERAREILQDLFIIYQAQNTEAVKSLQSSLEAIFNSKLPLSLKELHINGDDILQMGIQGKRVGQILQQIFTATLTHELPNEREILLQYLNTHFL